MTIGILIGSLVLALCEGKLLHLKHLSIINRKLSHFL